MGNRLVNLLRLPLKRPFSRRTYAFRTSSGPTMIKKQNKRVFKRYSVEFDVSVKFPGDDKALSWDQGELQDVSGGGALFLPCQPEKYYAGQQIETIIYLAGTHDVRACIRAEATVVRVEGKEEDSADRSVRVAVRFDRTFDFERIDSSDPEMKE